MASASQTPAQKAARHAAAIKAAATRRANRANGGASQQTSAPNYSQPAASAPPNYSAPSAAPNYSSAPPRPRRARRSRFSYGGASTSSAPAYKAPTAPIWPAPPDARALAFAALAQFESAAAAQLNCEKDPAKREEMRAGFEKYQKCKALAIAPGTPIHEANAALRMAAIALIKQTF